jgi:hypothetical protein
MPTMPLLLLLLMMMMLLRCNLFSVKRWTRPSQDLGMGIGKAKVKLSGIRVVGTNLPVMHAALNSWPKWTSLPKF